jgi:hypothetical protein
MTVVEDPTQGLSEGIGWVGSPFYVAQEYVTSFDPGEQGKELDINMMTAFSRLTIIGHHDCGDVVHVKQSGTQLREAQFIQYGVKVLGIFATTHTYEEFCLS